MSKKVIYNVTNKELYRIITEEVSKFNYLDIDSIKEEADNDELLNSREFQTRLIHDIMGGGVRFKNEYGIIDDIDDNGFGDNVIPRLEKQYSFDYNYNGKPFNLELDIEGRNLPVTTDGQHIPATHLQPAEYPEAENVDYSGVDILFWSDGIEIKMPWFQNNPKLKDKFVRNILGNIPE